jgi:hypothetical protein
MPPEPRVGGFILFAAVFAIDWEIVWSYWSIFAIVAGIAVTTIISIIFNIRDIYVGQAVAYSLVFCKNLAAPRAPLVLIWPDIASYCKFVAGTCHGLWLFVDLLLCRTARLT